jgi:CBS domain containing-hemolysin-like protein
MALPAMDSDPTVPRPPLTPTSTLAEAWAHLRATGERMAVVWRHDQPVGMVGAEALLDGIRCGRSGDPVATVMEYVAVHVDSDADAGATLRQFRRAAWDWLRE